ncbi:MAG: hypothetical protein ACYDHE_08270 [Candidatus Acidiferrales bacterium]
MTVILTGFRQSGPAAELVEDLDPHECAFSGARRELAPIVRPALMAIEGYCCDALPMAGITREYPS